MPGKILVVTYRGKFIWRTEVSILEYRCKGEREPKYTWALRPDQNKFETKVIRKIGRILAESMGQW